MEAYRARSATLGRRVRVVSAGEAFTGMAQEITDMGTLIVLDEQGGAPRSFRGGCVCARADGLCLT